MDRNATGARVSLQTAAIQSGIVDLDLVHEEDRSLVRGIRDFCEIAVKKRQTQPVAPSRLVRAVLRLCKRGGMTQRDLGSVFGDPHDRGRAWSRYYRRRQQMTVGRLLMVIKAAVDNGWMDVREPSELPDMQGKTWETVTEQELAEWINYQLPKPSQIARERIKAIEACTRMKQRDLRIDLDTVRQVACCDLDVERRLARLDNRVSGQMIRRAKETWGDVDFWVELPIEKVGRTLA